MSQYLQGKHKLQYIIRIDSYPGYGGEEIRVEPRVLRIDQLGHQPGTSLQLLTMLLNLFLNHGRLIRSTSLFRKRHPGEVDQRQSGIRSMALSRTTREKAHKKERTKVLNYAKPPLCQQPARPTFSSSACSATKCQLTFCQLSKQKAAFQSSP